ncbi:hypothetical protein K402DRAFT_356601, partial [Aulographum hederae CBS 113979]
CAGFRGLDCASGFVCIDDKLDDCDPENGGSDCPGVCFPVCGGFAGVACQGEKEFGVECRDIADDGCDAETGGADCQGWCAPKGW